MFDYACDAGMKPYGQRHRRNAQSAGETKTTSIRFSNQATNAKNGVKKLLLNQMNRAKRAGAWFRLSRLERGLYTLALRLEVKFESRELLKALVSILKTLRESSDQGYIALSEAMRLAWAFSEAAVSAGNISAREWRSDRTYIRFLAMISK